MSQPINRYKADLRDVRFVLFEQFKLQDILGKAVRELGPGGGRDRPRRGLHLVEGEARPAERGRRRHRLHAGRGRQGQDARRLQGRVEVALRRRLAPPVDPRGVRRPGRPVHAARDGRGDHVRRQHGVQHVPGADPGRRRRHPALRHQGADRGVLHQAPRRHLRRHDVPDRAPRRLRRRQRADQGRADGRRQVQDPRHQDLHLRRRPRPGEEHPAPGAGQDRGRAGRHQGPVACSSSRAIAPTARRTTSRSRRSSTRWASRRRRPRCSTSATTTAASASWSAPRSRRACPRCST
jgi:hypothetical protein